MKPQRELQCANCRGVFHGTEDNIKKRYVDGDKVYLVCYCDNCLKDLNGD